MSYTWASPQMTRQNVGSEKQMSQTQTTDITAVFPPAVTLLTCPHVTEHQWVNQQSADESSDDDADSSGCRSLSLSEVTNKLRCFLFLKKHQYLFFQDLKKPRHWLWTWLHQINFKMVRESTQKRDGRFFFPLQIWQIRVKASMFARSTVECVHLLRFIRQK